MNIGDLLFGMIVLILMVFVFLSPLLRKLFSSATNSTRGERDRNNGEEIKSTPLEEPIGEVRWKNQDSQAEINRITASKTETKSIVEKIESMTPLKKAVIWKEILDKPVGLRNM